MKYKRRRPATASRLTIRHRLPWPVKGLAVALLLGIAVALASWSYRMGRASTGFDPEAARQQLAELTTRVHALQAERDRLRGSADAAESAINIERATREQLATQIKTLEADNAKLKEDLAFFESMLPTGTGAQAVAIARLDGELEAPTRLRYRLLVRQGARGQDFSGSLQLAVSVQQHGAARVLLFPADGGTDPRYRLEFKYYQRLEGVLDLPDGVTVKTIEARVLEKGKIRARQSIGM